jgi:hypothetical protein
MTDEREIGNGLLDERDIMCSGAAERTREVRSPIGFHRHTVALTHNRLDKVLNRAPPLVTLHAVVAYHRTGQHRWLDAVR